MEPLVVLAAAADRSVGRAAWFCSSYGLNRAAMTFEVPHV